MAVKLKPSTFATAIGRDAALTKQCDRLGDTNVGALLSFIRICTQYLTLAWLRERERIRPLGAYSQPPVQESLEKNFFKKTFENIWWLKLNPLPLHPLSKPIAQQEEEFFERLIDKQTSSTSLYIIYMMYGKTRTVNK